MSNRYDEIKDLVKAKLLNEQEQIDLGQDIESSIDQDISPESDKENYRISGGLLKIMVKKNKI